MGDLIVLAVKAVAGLFWLFFQGIRLAGLALGGVIGVTEQLVRQRSSGARFSPDRRYWWNGSRWVPARHPIAWLIPGGTALCAEIPVSTPYEVGSGALSPARSTGT